MADAELITHPGRPMKALLVDFDGLILDTETADFEAWRSIYDEHGVELPRERWVGVIGSDGSGFDPLVHLQQLTGGVSVPDVQARRRRVRDELIETLRPLSGVVDWLKHGRSRGLSLAIASSSPRSWVEGHLGRLELLDYFDELVTRDRVERAKPHPDLYELALHVLGVDRGEALALEDSPNGVAAAVAAGIYCVAVPSAMVLDQSFAAADLVLDSLAQRTLDEVLDGIRRPATGPTS